MKKYMIVDNKEKELVKFEYSLGEQIILNSTIPIKCIKKEEMDGELLQYFKSGRITFDYNED